MTADVSGRGFAYDAENVLRRVTDAGAATVADYAYYADGARSVKTAGGATSVFYYAGDQEIVETDGAGATRRRYVRLLGAVDEPLLMIDYTGSGCPSGCETYAHQNRLGSVVAVTDDAGILIEKYTYSPYGESGSEGDSGFPFRFTGQKLDAETGLYYYKARYYDPETGRFLQTDPMGYEDQMNLYAYVHNDPVNGWDPTGMAGCGSRIDGVNNCSGASFLNYERSFISGAIETYLETGKHAKGTSSAEQTFIEDDVAGGLTEARELGKQHDTKSFYRNVETGGKWDFKNRTDLRSAGISSWRLEGAGNWFFGTAGAAWEAGAFGPLSFLSQSTGVGESVLLSGAGIYQMRSDRTLRWSGLQILLGPLPCPRCRRGDNPGDQQLISRGYDFYARHY